MAEIMSEQEQYLSLLMEHEKVNAELKKILEETKELEKQSDKMKNELKTLESDGKIVGEVVKQLNAKKFIVKATNEQRYTASCSRQLDKSKLKPGTRVALDLNTRTIMGCLPREEDPNDDPGDDTYKTLHMAEVLEDHNQTLGDVLKQLPEEKLIVKATNGHYYTMDCRLDKSKLKPGTCVVLDMPAGRGKAALVNFILSSWLNSE